MPHRGRRIAITVRLPYDEYREMASRARGRGWSLSDFIGFCVRREMGVKAGPAARRNLPDNRAVLMRPVDDGE